MSFLPSLVIAYFLVLRREEKFAAFDSTERSQRSKILKLLGLDSLSGSRKTALLDFYGWSSFYLEIN